MQKLQRLGKPMQKAVKTLTAALMAAALSASPSFACAEEWHYGTYEIDQTMKGHTAYVRSDSGQYTLSFDCDDYWNVRIIYVGTPVRWEATTSYAPEVPTTFDDGRRLLDVAGMFEDRNGQLFVSYNENMMEAGAFDAIVDLLVDSNGPLQVSFFSYSAAFQMDLARERIAAAAHACKNPSSG
jgi:hypothetical protein